MPMEPWWTYSAGDRKPQWPTSNRFFPLVLETNYTPILVLTAADGTPAKFHWGERHCAVAHIWGPERIETGWWRGLDVRRDYYVIETDLAERFWIFNDLVDGSWFLHGVFA